MLSICTCHVHSTASEHELQTFWSYEVNCNLWCCVRRFVPIAEHPRGRCGACRRFQTFSVHSVVRRRANHRHRRLARFTASHWRQRRRLAIRRIPVRRSPQMYRTRLQHQRCLNYHSQAGKSISRTSRRYTCIPIRRRRRTSACKNVKRVLQYKEVCYRSWQISEDSAPLSHRAAVPKICQYSEVQ